MDNNFTLKKGFTLLEVTVVMAVVIVLLSSVISRGMHWVNRARFQATVREMGSIVKASIDYYNSSSSDPAMLTWPPDISNLAPIYMPQAIISSPLGGSYRLNFGRNAVTVSTVIPKGILKDTTEGSFLNIVPQASGDQISITESVPNEFSSRLVYDLSKK